MEIKTGLLVERTQKESSSTHIQQCPRIVRTLVRDNTREGEFLKIPRGKREKKVGTRGPIERGSRVHARGAALVKRSAIPRDIGAGFKSSPSTSRLLTDFEPSPRAYTQNKRIVNVRRDDARNRDAFK